MQQLHARARLPSRTLSLLRAASQSPPLPLPPRSLRCCRPTLRTRLASPPRARGAPGTADGPDSQAEDDALGCVLWRRPPVLRLILARSPALSIAGFDPMEEVGVPRDQRPVNELKALRDDWLYSWAALEPPQLAARAGVLFAGVFALVAGPVSNGTFDPARQPLEFGLAAAAGSLVVVAVALLRIYLGWAYVGQRLLAAVVEYEETGWYDGQLFVKPPKVLARDRLLGAYQVNPALARLRGSLVASGAALAVASVALSSLISDGKDADGVYGRAAGPRVLRDGPAYRRPEVVAEAGEEEEETLEGLRYDDRAANAEAAAIRQTIGNVPAYCQDRYFKAVAGEGVDCEMLKARFRSEGVVGFEEPPPAAKR